MGGWVDVDGRDGWWRDGWTVSGWLIVNGWVDEWMGQIWLMG